VRASRSAAGFIEDQLDKFTCDGSKDQWSALSDGGVWQPNTGAHGVTRPTNEMQIR